MIDRQTIDKILEAANIVDVVGDFVTLRKAGVNMKGLCPFHNEKTPSFVVSPAKNMCHCFGCGKGGTPVSFLMEHEQMTYPEALRWLANKYHIEIVEKEYTAEERQQQTDRESMFILNEWAMKYFENTLYNNVDGRAVGMQYLRSRGFRDDIIKKFHLGYALNGKSLLAEEAMKQGYQEKYLIATGLCYKKDNGDVCDRYYGRVIFPWLSVSGKVCAFGGRVLDSRTKGVQQKYVNSPESEIYHKGNELYGIFQAKRSIVQHDMVYMVEGYTDVVSMHQCGIENVVANSGTALSKHQIRLLHRFTSNITLLYDGDEAGIHAALRGTDMLLEEGMNIRVVLFPDGDDPDSFARKHTAEEYQKFIDDNSQDFIAFKIHLLLDGVTDPIRKAEAISSIVESVSKIDDSIKRSTYIKECSQRIGINEQALIASMNRFIHTHIEEKEKRARSNEAVTSSQPPRGEESDTHSGHIVSSRGGSVEGTSNLEYLIMREIVQHGQTVLFNDVETTEGKRIKLDVVHFIDYDMKEDDMQFRNPTYNRILQMAVEYEGSVPLTTFLVNNPDIEISRIAADMAVERYHLSKYLEQESSADEIYRQVRHMLVDFKLERFEEKITFLKAELKEVSGDLKRTSSILNELNLCQQQRNMLAKDVGKNILK